MKTVKVMNNTLLMRKELKKILLVQWSRFGAVPIKINGSTLFVGINGSGKSTILDALTYLYAGNTNFNIAAKDRDRTVVGYVRGDTKSKGADQYLRNGNVISYIVMEFFDPTVNKYVTAGVCIESPDTQEYNPFWFIKPDAQIDDFNFYKIEGEDLTVTPRNELRVKGVKMKADEFLKKDKGTAALRRTLGLRCSAAELKHKLNKMMSFKIENNIDEFIRESVLPDEKITTIDNLKEQKHQFEKIKETFDGIITRKKMLDDVEACTIEYEKKQKEFDLKKAVLLYQNKLLSEKEYINHKSKLEKIRKEISHLNEQEAAYNVQLNAAENVKNEAYLNYNNNDLAAGIRTLRSVINEQETQKSQHENNISFIRQKRKLILSVKDICGFDHDLIKTIEGFDTVGLSSDEKRRAFDEIKEIITVKTEDLKKRRWQIEVEAKETDDRISELSECIKELENNNKDFPKAVVIEKNTINKGLESRGIKARVRLLAELVEDISQPEWREALEVYLGRKKFDLIIDAEYVKDAMEIYYEKKLSFSSLVLSDKLEDLEAEANSAASILSVPNKYARRYINYLLGRIYLCNTLEELHEHPQGGIMSDGALAKGYTMRNLDLSKADYYLGRDAIKLRLDKLKNERNILIAVSNENASSLLSYQQMLDLLSASELKGAEPVFASVDELSELIKKLSENKARVCELENDPRLTELQQIYDKAVKEYERINKAKEGVIKRQGECGKELIQTQDQINEDRRILEKADKAYQDFILMHLEYKKASQEEYEKASQNRPDGIVLKQATIDRIDTDRSRRLEKMIDSQLKYNSFAGKDPTERGVQFIPKFRSERDQLANVDAEEVKNKLEEKGKLLESTFITDFIAELCEKVNKAKEEIDAINRELKSLPFGQDIYEFKAKERSDKQSFFRIKRKIYDRIFGLNEAFLASMNDDPEFMQDVEEFMEIILNDTNESEYADYRYYFQYDMGITNTIGTQNIEADLSEKQGSASNGEKQTPYYIILAASLMQCYPKNTSCARLAFIDEAFAALSQDRIEQMVKYLQQNGFQVIYAAPPEKIKSIGSNIDSTISLVETGRYTNVVEGLTDEFLEKSDHADEISD